MYEPGVEIALLVRAPKGYRTSYKGDHLIQNIDYFSMQRSRSPWGPFHPSPHGPFLTHRHTEMSLPPSHLRSAVGYRPRRILTSAYAR